MAVIEAIQTVYLEADTASVTMSSIPATYQHLQLRITFRGIYQSTGFGQYIIFNADTGSNYNVNVIYAGDSTASGWRTANASNLELTTGGISMPSAQYPSTVLDIYDYANTNKNTSFDWETNKVPKSSRYQLCGGGFWDDTAALHTINWTTYSTDIGRGTSITLYGLNDS